ncbi:hypothetical protein BH23ACT2_BH23ACT2_21300 [soil metagenome]
MFVVLLLLIVAPLVELYVIIQVAQVIGGWQAVGLLLLLSIIGVMLLKQQGLTALARIGEAVNQGRVPGREIVDGFLILVAGALLLAPGFVGDVLGFALLIPPTRAVVRAPLMKRFAAGRQGAFLSGRFPGGGRFVGTFNAGDVHDASGRDASGRDDSDRNADGTDRPQLDS